MGESQITFPRGEYGGAVVNPQNVYPFECVSVAITANMLVTFVYDVATGKVQVRPTTTALDPALIAGVALEAIAIGAIGQVCTRGFALVNVGAGTVAIGDQLIGTATAGLAAGVTADATTIAGDTGGVYLGVKLASNLAPVWIS